MLEHKCFNFSANALSNTPFCTLLSHPQPRLIHLETNLHFISPNPISINIKVSTEKAASEANVPVCCALWPDEGTWVSHPLSLTRICNLRERSSSPNIPIAHGDDQATLWKPNGTCILTIKREIGEEITLWKALDALEKLVTIFKGFWRKRSILFGHGLAPTVMCFGCPLLQILWPGCGGASKSGAGWEIWHLSTHHWVLMDSVISTRSIPTVEWWLQSPEEKITLVSEVQNICTRTVWAWCGLWFGSNWEPCPGKKLNNPE